jgi:demethylmenaquinone methyltransferase / 2-methoxy-6-polyprenyl-1,4-benzoquinol methylase
LKNQLPREEEKALVVREMFDRIAPRYDALNRLFSFRLDQRWRKETIRSLALSPGEILLDLACGTGDLSELAAHVGAQVVGVDFAGNMLMGARRRGIHAEFVQADAALLPFPDGWASAVVSGFALRNFVSLPAVFSEIMRVLVPGGRMALLEVDSPRNAFVRWGHHLYFNHVVPVLGGLLSDSWAYSYLPRSVAYLPQPEVLQRIIETAGFHAVTRRQLSGGIAQLITAVK